MKRMKEFVEIQAKKKKKERGKYFPQVLIFVIERAQILCGVLKNWIRILKKEWK